MTVDFDRLFDELQQNVRDKRQPPPDAFCAYDLVTPERGRGMVRRIIAENLEIGKIEFVGEYHNRRKYYRVVKDDSSRD